MFGVVKPSPGDRTASVAVTVGQPASHTTRPSRPFSSTFTFGFPPSFQSRVVGVGQVDSPEECALSDVRRADAR
ncbi:hypothetical protein IE00_05690 [Paracoccus sp. SM22M-07]|nr:hypothetical protein IE00_05690 [Paracoccus sp. SM22M-07]